MVGGKGFCMKVEDADALKAAAKSRRSSALAIKHRAIEDRIRALFDAFDKNGDGALQADELAALLRNCFPSRCADATAIANATWKKAGER